MTCFQMMIKDWKFLFFPIYTSSLILVPHTSSLQELFETFVMEVLMSAFWRKFAHCGKIDNRTLFHKKLARDPLKEHTSGGNKVIRQ